MVKKRRKLLPQDIQKKNNLELAALDNNVIESSLNKDTDQETAPIKNESEGAQGTNTISNNEIDIKSEDENETTDKQQEVSEDPNR